MEGFSPAAAITAGTTGWINGWKKEWYRVLAQIKSSVL